MLHSCLSKRIVSMLRGLFRDASIQPFLSRCRNQFWYFNSRYLPLPSTNPIPVLFVFFQICMSPCETLKSFFMQSKMRRKWAVAPLGGPLWLNECKVFFLSATSWPMPDPFNQVSIVTSTNLMEWIGAGCCYRVQKPCTVVGNPNKQDFIMTAIILWHCIALSDVLFLCWTNL